MDVKPIKWSYSSIKAYESCPKKYYHLRILKDVKDESNVDALVYGTKFHETAEYFIRDGKPIPPEFSYATALLEKVKSFKGELHCEYSMGLTADLEPCAYDAANVWWRGTADLVVISGTTAKIFDYKTSKSSKYADVSQLELMALALFKHHPEITHIRTALLFVVTNELVKAEFEASQQADLWQKWLWSYENLSRSVQTGVWNAKSSGLCKRHCPVKTCIHNGDYTPKTELLIL